MATDFQQDISALGLITASFLLGQGIAQIPAGLSSARRGPRTATIVGSVLASAAVLLSGFAPSMAAVIVLRFVVGLGTGFANAPGLSLAKTYGTSGTAGFAIGVYEAFTVIGGLLGLVADGTLGLWYGWRAVMISNGIAGLALGPLLLRALPRGSGERSGPSEISVSRIKPVVLDKDLLIVGVALLGLAAAATLCGNLMVYYLEDQFALDPVTAGTIAGLVVLSSLVGMLAFGRLSDRTRNVRGMILLSGILSFAGLALSAIPSEYAALSSNVIVGVWTGGGTVLALTALRSARGRGEAAMDTLRLSWLLAFSTAGSLGAPIWFSFLTVEWGYPSAWLLSGAALAASLLPIAVVGRRIPRALPA